MKRIEDQSVLDGIQRKIDKRILPLNLFSVLKDTDAVIFGGAVRNAISGDPINDIDIICYQNSFNIIDKRLREDFKDSVKTETEDVGLSDSYAEFAANSKIRGVFNYYIRPKSGLFSTSSMIQLILLKYPMDDELRVENIREFVSDVDIRACAMLYAPLHNTLLECIQGAFEDCKRKRIFVNKDALMYFKDKCNLRIARFKNLGWKVVN